MLPSYNFLSVCSLVSMNCEMATTNPYGHITDCSISLRGRLFEGVTGLITLMQKNNRTGGLREVNLMLDNDVTGRPMFWVCEKNNESEWKESILNLKSVAFLELYRTRHSDDEMSNLDSAAKGKDDRATALLLQRKPNDTVYTRIGLLDYVPVTWFDEFASEQIVTIVRRLGLSCTISIPLESLPLRLCKSLM
ncbi:hypothetical protein GQ44DRAFT_698379 [Phaeosphaeriaceae sp. PMI808]|nr:hypothetical protein GQ44DRAFT_698379 [Phaeosphaeriaceae sp. PMI808]